jgi:hypothetical protein
MLAQTAGHLLQDLSLASIMQYLPRKDVKRALTDTQTDSIRQRLLPADMVAYLVVMLALYSDASVRENLRILMEPLRRRFGAKAIGVPTGAAITKARRRLGSAPFARLFDALARPVATPKTPEAFYNGFRVVAVDGTTANIQDTDANRARFGIHANQHGSVGYPQVKVVILTECGTRVPLGCAYGGGDEYEPGLFDRLQPKLEKDMLLLADRYYYNFSRWKACAERAGALLWRVRDDLNLTPVSVLEDGSWLAEIRPSNKLTRSGRSEKGEQCVLRVVEYRPAFADGTEGERVRLATTLLDARKAPAEELCHLFARRWETETGFDELKTHLRGVDRVLRSPVPELVEQELYGFLLAYTVVRRTMAESARLERCSPKELSFIHAVRVIRRRITFPPDGETGGSKSVSRTATRNYRGTRTASRRTKERALSKEKTKSLSKTPAIRE